MEWFSCIDRDNLIDLIIFIIYNSKMRGPINATATNPITNEQFSSILVKTIRRPHLIKIPAFIF